MLGKCGEIPTLGDLFGPGGTKLLDSLRLPEPTHPGWLPSAGCC